MMTDVAKRGFLKIQVAPPEREAFERLYLDLGMTQIEATTRLVRWLLTQSDVIQTEVLGTAAKSIRRDVARMILEEMMKEPAKQRKPHRLVAEIKTKPE